MIVDALMSLATPSVLMAVLIGTFSGMVVGGMPGLTATMAVALLIPVTFSLEPLTGLVLMGGVYCGAMYGGSIPAILLHTPGTPAAVATALEGYPLTQQGRGGLALKVSVISSFAGGIFSTTVLLLTAPLLAIFALKFGPPEYFLLAILGLVGIVSLAEEGRLIKALISGILGLVVAVVGTDPISGALRYTMDVRDLYDGVQFMPVLIGMFSITEMLKLTNATRIMHGSTEIGTIKREPMPKGLGKFIALGSGVGTLVGILPGEGATIAAFISYNIARQHSKNRKLFGKGNPEGIAAAESGNNGCVGGSLVPTLTLGIPGNSVAAALLGGLMVHGLIPGPELFTKYGQITYGFIFSMFLANLIFLALGLYFAPYFARISLVPTSLLIPGDLPVFGAGFLCHGRRHLRRLRNAVLRRGSHFPGESRVLAGCVDPRVDPGADRRNRICPGAHHRAWQLQRVLHPGPVPDPVGGDPAAAGAAVLQVYRNHFRKG